MHAGGQISGQQRRLTAQFAQTLHGRARLVTEDLIEHEAGHGLRDQGPAVVDGCHPDSCVTVLAPPFAIGGGCRQDPAVQTQTPHSALRIGGLHALACLLLYVDPRCGGPATGILRGFDEGA